LSKRIQILLIALFGVGAGGCAAPAMAKDSPSSESAAGQKIYVAKCAKCHKLYDPAKYSDADWQIWMAKMSKKAKLKPEQVEVLSRYIAENLRAPRRATNAVPVVN
jgi:mono/diheme cytochrome c family protein